jgi:hypothetical protein
MRWLDGCRPPVDLCPPLPTIPSAGDDYEDVSGANSPDHPFSTELSGMEINTWIRGVLAYGADQNFGSSPVPSREGVDSPWVSLLELTFVCLCQFLLLKAYASYAGS